MGKGNGTQNGVKYFECRNNYCVFARTTNVKILEEEVLSIAKPAGIITKGKKPDESKIDSETKNDALDEKNSGDSKTREEVKLQIAERKLKIVENFKKKDTKDEIRKEDDPNLELSLVQKEETIKIIKQDLHKSNSDLEQAKKAIAADALTITELKTKINLLEQQIKSKGGNSDMQELIETLTLEKEIAEENVETLQKELDDTKLELQELKEEIELRNLELEQLQSEAVEGSDYDSTDYKLALKKLYTESQNAKVDYENRISQLENQLADIPNVEAKVRQIADLKQELGTKQKEIKNLKDALEEASEYSEMIEKLTEDNYNKTEKIGELEDRLKELQELHELEEQIAEDQAELEKSLNAEIHDREFTIQTLKNELSKMELQRIESEKTMNQFRVRVCELQNDIESLKDQLADTGEEEKMKKMQILMEKNVTLNNKMREMMTLHITGKMNEVLYVNLLKKVNYMEISIPDNVLTLLDLGTLHNFLMLSSLRGKAFILVSEVIKATIDTVHDKYLIR